MLGTEIELGLRSEPLSILHLDLAVSSRVVLPLLRASEYSKKNLYGEHGDLFVV